MKKLLFTMLVVALTAPLAAAELPLTDASNQPAVAATDTAPGLDVGALSPEEVMALLQVTGLGVPEPVTAAPPPCPVNVVCTSPTGVCAIALNCTFTNLGPCCTSGGLHRCCLNGDIIVKTCACHGPGCPAAQVSSSCM